MDNNNEAIQLLDILYGMIADAWEVPMNKDKCIIEREKALDIISKVKIILPTELTEAKRLVSTRNEFILNTRKEAEAIKKNAQETQRRLLDEQQIIKTANERAAAMDSRKSEKRASGSPSGHQYHILPAGFGESGVGARAGSSRRGKNEGQSQAAQKDL